MYLCPPKSALALPLALFAIGLAAMVAALAGCAANDTRMVKGTVVDALSGTPVAGASVQATSPAGTRAATTDRGGGYQLDGLAAESTVVVTAERHQETRFTVGTGGDITTALPPIVLQGTVTDAYTGKPLAGVKASQGEVTATTSADGAYRLVGVAHGEPIHWEAEGYADKEQAYTDGVQLDVQLRPTSLSGRVTAEETGAPVVGATVSLGDRSATTDADGRYLLSDVSLPGTVVVKASGFETSKASVSERATLDVGLQPFVVRAAYLTYYGVGDAGLRDNVVSLIDSSELNAVVIDIKGDIGMVAYKSAVPLAQAIGANDNPTIPDISKLLADLKAKGIYTIARIVVFKDNMLGRNGGKAGVDVAVRNANSGGLWIDGENLAWVDPFRTEVWDYNVALAVEAAKKGFDEIQFDYIRFPTDPSAGNSVGAAVFSRQSTEANRTAAIDSFLAKARAALQPLGVSLSVDVFGYTCWREDDMGIGQNIINIAKYVDSISPMVYPSTFSDGLPMEPNYADAPAYPYEVVYYSIKRATERLKGLPVKIRPWLQYFDDYPWASGKEYNAPEILAQKRAASEGGGIGYLLWDPTNRFGRGGLGAP